MATKVKASDKLVDEMVKNECKKKAIKQATTSKNDNELFKKVLEQSKLPVEFTDYDFKLGEGELDIRPLSNDNKAQLNFRLLSCNIGLQKEIATFLLDIERLMMLVLSKMGVKDIDVELGNLLKELAEKSAKNKA